MLIAAAAQTWNVSKQECIAEAGFVKKGDELFDAKGNRVEFDLITNSTSTATERPTILLQPKDFSLRVPAQDYDVATFNASCNFDNGNNPNFPSRTLQSYIEQLSAATIHRLRTGAEHASDL